MRDDQEIDLRYPPRFKKGTRFSPPCQSPASKDLINERCLPGWEFQEQSIPLPHINHAQAEPRRIGRIRRGNKDNRIHAEQKSDDQRTSLFPFPPMERPDPPPRRTEKRRAG